MKKKPEKKLTLSRETLRALTDPELRRAVGGFEADTVFTNCGSRTCPPTTTSE